MLLMGIDTDLYRFSIRTTCPPREILTGGGFASPPQLELRTSFPNGNEWVATAGMTE